MGHGRPSEGDGPPTGYPESRRALCLSFRNSPNKGARMIHPATEVGFVSDTIGYGVFATARIPKGTITYVEDIFDIRVSPQAFAALDTGYREILDKYSCIDVAGTRIMSWDHAKYMNHSCNCNTIDTAYCFEIAIRDIEPGEEITDEYGLFNISEEVDLACKCPSCRGKLRPSDIDIYHPV
ncbi:MAG: SET domain-containing protein-lysine N-methyltransferase [Chitinivibrionales bacterium]|nr:SET domain-containing protein-lysine N-methyltransferase [Chitinivibrionales bacterium]MBD3397143.1 SET domain-containing protein-lysine N-methyltransferase [Chitinivibrionales bacterium]